MTKNQIDNILNSNSNIFITGAAGTGKSYLLREFIKKSEEEGKKVVVTASTGIAAINVGGITVHRAFNVPIPALSSPLAYPLSKLKTIILSDIVIIDEVSMLRNDVFEYVWGCIKRIKKELNKEIRLIVCGDFYQLPPVVKETDEKKLASFGFDKSGFAFTTNAWKEAKFKIINLTSVKRQSNKTFIENLSKLRTGDKNSLIYFNNFVGIPDNNSIYLCSTNAEALKINEERLEQINSPSFIYKAKHTGYVKKENFPAEEVLVLKPGARVIFTTNDIKKNLYQNGTSATIIECGKDYVRVVLESGDELTVYPHKWPIYSYQTTGGILSKKEIASFEQINLKLAFAITIHKSQGQGYQNVVISPKTFADGQLYVALSRITSSGKIIITEPILPEYLLTNKIVDEFYKDFNYNISEKLINKRKEIEKKQKNTLARKKKRKKTMTKTKSSITKTKSRPSTIKNKKSNIKKVTIDVKKSPTKKQKDMLKKASEKAVLKAVPKNTKKKNTKKTSSSKIAKSPILKAKSKVAKVKSPNKKVPKTSPKKAKLSTKKATVKKPIKPSAKKPLASSTKKKSKAK